VGNAGSRCGNPGRPGRADVAPPRPFRRSQLCTLCWPALLRRPLAVRSRLGPNVDASLAGFKEVSYYHRVTPCGLSNRARRTPRSWRGLPPRRSPTLGVGAFRRRGTAGFRRAPVLTQVRSMGPVDPVLPRVAPALAWTLNKYTPAKGV